MIAEPLAPSAGPLLACRAELVAILDQAGVRVLADVGGRMIAPCAIIEPGDPFVGPAHLGGAWRQVRWHVVLVVGAGGAAANQARMLELIQGVVLAIGSAPGWSTPTVSGARLLRVMGVEGGYTAAELSADTIADMTGG